MSAPESYRIEKCKTFLETVIAPEAMKSGELLTVAISKHLAVQDKYISELEAENKRLREALKMLYEETVDYIQINHLGDPHHNQSMKLAKAALEGK